MKSLVFDTSSIISLAMNHLLWVLKSLKKQFKGDFLITEGVKQEVVDNPLKTKRFKLEAVMLRDFIFDGNLIVRGNGEIREKAKQMLNLVNNIFKAKGNYIKILHMGEIEALVLALEVNAKAIVVDERTLRFLIENYERVMMVLKNKLHTYIEVDEQNLKLFQEKVNGLKVLRSTELILMAYELGLLEHYITSKGKKFEKFRVELLSGALWGLKLKGCSISEQEITKMLQIEKV